jgi:electron-transferring-flavoprotein dehydrogenase
MSEPELDPKPLDADILCVGFGPASGGFLTTLSRALAEGGIGSQAFPGMPPQVICYERADDIAFGVSGVVTRARAIRASLPDFDPAEVPMATPVRNEKLIYLLDPEGASRRPLWMQAADWTLRAFSKLSKVRDYGYDVPFVPDFLHKRDGFVLALGQFNQWVGQQVMMSGQAQVWPGTPVAAPLIEDGKVAGVVLAGEGAEIRAPLTVVADGPVGAVSRHLDDLFGLPPGHKRDEWALGMKFVIELPEGVDLEPGTVFHTIGYPEPEIFGFFYVHPGRVVSTGIFVPSWMESPVRTAYRYLQHYIQHPYLWRYLKGGTLRSWGAKSLLESGKRGEPFLAGDGYARIGENSGSTNVLTGSGVDEAWLTGVQLAEAVIELMRDGKPYTRENLEAAYVTRRRASWLEPEGRIAENARNGFQRSLLLGFLGMAVDGLSGGRLHLPRARSEKRPQKLIDHYFGRLPHSYVKQIADNCFRQGRPLHDELMNAIGWPEIPYDGQLLISHQDALLIGGKVQAPSDAADHVIFRDHALCESCDARTCIEICSGEAIHPGEGAVPAFDREKCVHCGACLWNCPVENVLFAAAPGGLHSAEN